MSITLSGDGYRRVITNQGMYPDNTPMLKIDDFDEMVRKADTLTIQHTSMAEFVTAMFFVDGIRSNNGHIYKLVLPYVPGARQDRSNPTGDVLLTIASVARMLNERMFQHVAVLDPHSQKTLDLIHRVRVYPQEYIYWFNMTDVHWDGIIAADEGGRERAEKAASALGGLPVYYGSKHRDVGTGKLSGFSLEEVPQGHYLVVDDICDGGGTFEGLGLKILEQGSTADLFVSHGLFSKGTTRLRQYYNNIYTTDSIIPGDISHTIVTVLSIVEDMEKM